MSPQEPRPQQQKRSSDGPKRTGEDAGKDAKRPCLDDESTCVVVVGGTEFQESVWELRRWSGYFDAAFRSGMVESRTRRFEFPHRSPKQWETIKGILNPFSDVTITRFNLEMAFSWFDELAVCEGIKACDEILYSELEYAMTHCHGLFFSDEFFAAMRPSLRYNLPLARSHSIKCLKKIWTDQRHYEFSRQQVEKLVGCISCAISEGHDEISDEMWGLVNPYLPDSEAKREELIKNSLLPSLLHASVQREKTAKQIKRMVGVMEKSENIQVKTLKSRFLEDDRLKDVFRRPGRQYFVDLLDQD